MAAVWAPDGCGDAAFATLGEIEYDSEDVVFIAGDYTLGESAAGC